MITVGARASKLSIKQVEEVVHAMQYYDPDLRFSICCTQTIGDKDLKTSLRSLEKTNFFTYEVDQLVIEKKCQIAIHSAKDLPDPLPQELEIIAITQCLNAQDVLVIPFGKTERDLEHKPVIATSSINREKNILKQFPTAKVVDLRGTIGQRIDQVLQSKVDGVVIAKVALMRLNLMHLNMIDLIGETTPLQGSLAIVARRDNLEMKELFKVIDTRQKRKCLYMGLNPERFLPAGELTHMPLIEILPKSYEKELLLREIQRSTHLIFTSPTSVKIFFENLKRENEGLNALKNKRFIVVGHATALALQRHHFHASYISKEESQEGVIELLKQIPRLKEGFVLYLKSALARPFLKNYLIEGHIQHSCLDLYDTALVKLKKYPDLSSYDDLVFTSSSCVKSFFENGLKLLDHQKVICRGKVTQKTLDSYSQMAIH